MQSGTEIKSGSVILAPYRDCPLWPALVRDVDKKKKRTNHKFIPFYSDDYVLHTPLSKVELFNKDAKLPDNASEFLIEAYEKAREFCGYTLEQAMEIFKNPEPRPVNIQEEQSPIPKAKKRKQPAEHNDEEIGEEGDQATGANLISDSSDGEESADELDTILRKNEPIIPPSAKRIRQLKPNEIIFLNAPKTQFKSKDQVVLIRNPNGRGLWPALPNQISEEKLCATFEVFPRSPKKTRVSRQQPKFLRTTDVEIFELDESKIDSMINFAKDRDQKLFETLKDVKQYLQDNHRFDQKVQVDGKFKDEELFLSSSSDQQQKANEPSSLELDNLHLTTTSGKKFKSATNIDTLIHKIPKNQLKEQRLLKQKAALSRQDPKPAWLFSHPIYKPHYEIQLSDLISDNVEHYFERIWCNEISSQLHDTFINSMLQPEHYPSGFKINGVTGGIVSKSNINSALENFLKWIDLSPKLPRMSPVEKVQYAAEVMLKEACIFVLSEKRQFDRERAEDFLLDGQNYAYSKERGYSFDEMKRRLDDAIA